MNLYRYSFSESEKHVIAKDYKEAEFKINEINSFKNKKNETVFRKILWIKLIEENVG